MSIVIGFAHFSRIYLCLSFLSVLELVAFGTFRETTDVDISESKPTFLTLCFCSRKLNNFNISYSFTVIHMSKLMFKFLFQIKTDF